MKLTLASGDLSAAKQPRFIAWLLTGIVLLNLVILLLLSFFLYESRQQHARLARVTVDNLSRLLAHDLGSTFQKVDLTLQFVVDEAERQLRSGGINAKGIEDFIARQADRLPEISYLRMTNADGDLLYGTGLIPGRHVNLADRDYFAQHRNDPHSGLIVSKPIISRTSGKWQLALTRRINSPDGGFGGMVPALIELDKLTEKFASLNIGSQGIINIYDQDMAMIARYPAPPNISFPIGQRSLSHEFETAIAVNRNVGSYEGVSPFDGYRRIFSYRRIYDSPLLVLVGLSSDDYFGAWWQQVRQSIFLMMVFSLVTLGLARLMTISWNRRRKAEEQIAALAFHDVLTGLPNRRLFFDRAAQALATCARSRQHVALFFIDLDNFKALNDSRGHEAGDHLLRTVAQRLVSCVRTEDTVARLGGDEFVILLRGLSPGAAEAASQAEALGEKVLHAMNQRVEIEGRGFQCTSSIGISLLEAGQKTTIEELLQQADLAMYQAKTGGRNRLRFFDERMQVVVDSRTTLLSNLRDALQTGQLLLLYQPQVDTHQQVIGAEALVRWQHPTRGPIMPATFIPLAEESGLIVPLGLWVLEDACRQLRTWASAPDTKHLSVSVNISARQLQQDDFVDQILAIIQRTGINPQRLKLELTESQLVADVEKSIAKMRILKEIGVGFSLDDFGTGYSSLAYLKRLPLDQLKIDKSFVHDILIDSNDAAIASMIIALADTLGLPVIAEGVESLEQHERLKSMGCAAYQGYLFGKPMPVSELEGYIVRQQALTQP